MTHYAGIGSRQTPTPVMAKMTQWASTLDTCGYTLRSGGANGADTAFEAGVTSNHKLIFLPWRLFNGHPSHLHLGNPFLLSKRAEEIAEHFHPAWGRCSPQARLFHTRNSFQVLGARLDSPAAFVICWTPDGKDVGGTAQALRIARAYNIPILNLGSP